MPTEGWDMERRVSVHLEVDSVMAVPSIDLNPVHLSHLSINGCRNLSSHIVRGIFMIYTYCTGTNQSALLGQTKAGIEYSFTSRCRVVTVLRMHG